MKYKGILITGILSALMLCGSAEEGVAQRRSNPRFTPYSTVSFGVGTSNYYGELAGYSQPFNSFKLTRWNASLAYTRQFTPTLSARASFTYARIVGDDYIATKGNPTKNAAQFARNLHFRNDLKEFAVVGMYQFIPEGRNSNDRPKITPYAFLGVALLAHSPEARTPDNYQDPNDPTAASRQWIKLKPLNTEGQGQAGYAKPYSLITVAIPAGLGVRYAINQNFSVAGEIGFRYTFTDYLDDAGGNYADPNLLQGLSKVMADRRNEATAARKNDDRSAALAQVSSSNPEAFTGSVRGAKGVLTDGYLLTNFHVIYIIPGKIKCPVIK
jgi:hypothetical protein